MAARKRQWPPPDPTKAESRMAAAPEYNGKTGDGIVPPQSEPSNARIRYLLRAGLERWLSLPTVVRSLSSELLLLEAKGQR
jgi:hypothetical protein